LEPAVSLDPALLDILACPDVHHTPLTYDSGAQTLTCGECGRIFPVWDGIPVLLLDEATTPAAPASQAAPEADR
jgi:uncharacterized protein YbaR (Trm112 family)